MVSSKHLLGFAITACLVSAVICSIAAQPIGLMPTQYVHNASVTVDDVDTSAVDAIPELRTSFDEGIEESLSALTPRKAAGLRLAFGNEWRDVVRQTTRTHGWPVVRRHAAQVLQEMSLCGLDIKSEAGQRYFVAAMERRRPVISTELEQAILSADITT